MTDASSPTVWRRWLALELLRLRRAAGLDQKDVAKALRCTIAKVSYIESAERPVMLRDLDEVLLPLYGVPEDQWPTYIQAAKDSRRKGWWETYDAPALPNWFSLYVGLEQGASQIRTYEALAVPGLLQTHDYAEALTRRSIIELDDAEVARQVEARLKRQSVLDRRPAPLRLWVVLDEAALRRVVGSDSVMRAQLQYLLEASRHPKVTMQVMSFDRGAHPGVDGGSFSILDFPSPTDPGLVYAEHRGGALYLEQPQSITEHTVAFEHVCALANTPDESAKLIRGIAEEYA